MSIGSSLSNALSGLTAAARMAEVVSSNLANVMTDGYARRQLDLSSKVLGGMGSGVTIDGTSRMVDRGVLADRRLADAGRVGQEATTRALRAIEDVMGKADDPSGLPGRIAALEQALVTASADPGSDGRLAVVLTRLDGLADAINDRAAGIRNLRQNAENAIFDQVETLNLSLRQVERLNKDILGAQRIGIDPLGLIDQRQIVVDRIAAIVPVREIAQPGGLIALMTTGGAMILDGKALQFGFSAAHTVVPEMTLASGGLAGITLDGQPIDPVRGIGKLDGGSLGAAFKLRDATLVTAQQDLDALARDLVERFQDPAADPTRTPGNPGLLTDAGAEFDPLNTTGLSGRIGVNAAADPVRGGALFRLRDGIEAAGPGNVGDASGLGRLLDILEAPRAISTGGLAASAGLQAGRFASAIAQARLAGDEALSFSTARWSVFHEAELAGGVDSDFELQNLLRIEQAYAANARVVQTIETMIQKLLEI